MNKWLLALLLVYLLSPCESSAKAITTIDARYDLKKALRQYRQEITDAVEHSVKKRLRILIDSKRGFNVGYLKIPSYIRRLDVTVVIYVLRGRDLIRPIKVNLLHLNRKQVVYQINQNLKIRG